jgi:hypothetical protein
MTDTMTLKHPDLSSWDTPYVLSKGRLLTILKRFPTRGKVILTAFLFGHFFNFMRPLHKMNAQWNHAYTSGSVSVSPPKFDTSTDSP